ncbi:MAG: DNA polymerase IV [Ruminococcaceae bacterium]|nr:DNA polymerase IV [Oscillospiraceae bacterium]
MRTILHCDCNGFYASVECTLKPELKNVPMAVCGNPENRHGIILAKNDLAKAYNIKTAETIWQAKSKCPELVLVQPHHDLYQKYSDRINEIYKEYTDMVEPFGIDESWLDVTASKNLFGSGVEIADKLRERIKSELGLTISVGVSFNKVFAKLGSDYKKPDATTEFSLENWQEKIFPLSVGDLLFVGHKAEEKLNSLCIYTIGDLASSDQKILINHFGKMGETLWIYANGLDTSPVISPCENDDVKSVGNGNTFKKDLTKWEEVSFGVKCLSESVATRLRKKQLKCSTISVAIKDPEFKTISKQKKLLYPSYISREITTCALELIKSYWPDGKPIRTITITATNLIKEDEDISQLTLFEDDKKINIKREKLEKLEETLDMLKEKFGDTIGNLHS